MSASIINGYRLIWQALFLDKPEVGELLQYVLIPSDKCFGGIFSCPVAGLPDLVADEKIRERLRQKISRAFRNQGAVVTFKQHQMVAVA